MFTLTLYHVLRSSYFSCTFPLFLSFSILPSVEDVLYHEGKVRSHCVSVRVCVWVRMWFEGGGGMGLPVCVCVRVSQC